MKRFVYSPKVWAYIRCEDPTSGEMRTVDVSAHIISGNVTRNTNAVSTASLVLRNPNHIWTGKRGRPMFRPMDAITIWMMRRPGVPVQAFTGYLDRTPYFALYPGVTGITASCTLKKLLHTYFDPALPYMGSFLAQYGWAPKGSTGTWVHVPSQGTQLEEEQHFTDGGFGALLFGTLKHIGRWKSKDVVIEALPFDVKSKVSRIFKAFENDNDEATKELQTFLENMIGTGSYGGGDNGGSGGSADPSVRGNGNLEKAFNYMRDQGFTAEQAAGAVGSMMQESGKSLSPTALNPSSGAFGIAQWLGGRLTRLQQMSDYKSLETQLRFVWVELRSDEGAAYSAMKSAKTIEQATEVWTIQFERPGVHERVMETRIGYAKSVYNEYANKAESDEGDDEQDKEKPKAKKAVPNAHPQSAGEDGRTEDGERPEDEKKEDDPGISSPMKDMPTTGWPGEGGKFGASRSYGGHAGVDAPSALGQTWYSITDGVVEQVQQGWANKQPAVVIKTETKFDGYPSPLYLGYGSFQSVDVKVGDTVSPGTTLGKGGTHGTAPHLHFWLSASAGSANGDRDPESFLKAAAAGKQPSGGSAGSGGGGDSGSEAFGGSAAAFASQLALPGAMERAEALLLQGEKSLMNDKPLLPFIQQLTEGSMRHFQSLPDGRFFAFYPDYFGEFGKQGHNVDHPYIEIDDVEILDGNIDLTDEHIVTHQYVVGDTIPFGGITMPERIFSSGVVSIFNIFDSGEDGENAAVPGFMGAKGKAAAMKFLKRYGARPQVEEAAFIRSPYFELLVAYQRFLLNWSRQFQTEFSFTFMPELYPGGKVGFRQHGIKMYIESVSHDFDYSSGFSTTATLTAPASYGDKSPLEDGLLRNV